MNDWDPIEIRNQLIKEGQISRMPDEQSLLDEMSNTASGEAFLGLSLSRRRLLIIFSLTVIFLSTLLYRAYSLQIVQGDYYRKVAEGNRIRVTPDKAPRGLIYDRADRVLVKNVPSFTLTVVPADLPKNEADRADLINKIADIMASPDRPQFIQTTQDTINQASRPFDPVIIAENVEYAKALELKIKSTEWPGVSLNIDRVRDYYQGADETMSHVLGYLGRVNDQDIKNLGPDYSSTDQLGKAGLEMSYENILKGVDGKETVEVDAIGKTIKTIAKEPLKSGADLVLSIDTEVQQKLADLLAAELKQIHKSRASAVVIDTRDGEVLADVSLPSYDDNLFARKISNDDYQNLITDKDEPLYDRSISGEYPSGSTFKPVVAAAALEENVITRNTTVNSVGGIRVNQWYFPDWKVGGHGITNVTKALAWSVNTFFYMIGGGYQTFKGLGVSKIIRYGAEFGFGKKLGIDLPAESNGFLPTPDWKETVKNDRWYIGDTYHLAIGQGDLLVTPLQIAVMTASFANGGTVYQPHIVKAIINGDQINPVKPQIISQNVFSPVNVDIVRQGLREAVTYGSASSLNSLGVTMAGKTGTAQWTADPKKLPHAWFTGFAPYEKPEIAITVMIEEGGEGSSVSVPVAKQFTDWYFNVYKKEKTKLTQSENVDKNLD